MKPIQEKESYRQLKIYRGKTKIENQIYTFEEVEKLQDAKLV